jgi:hypothetical protein
MSLQPIAEQCVFEGGPGVIYARNIMAMLGDARNYDDASYCTSYRVIGNQSTTLQNSNNEISIYPNPTSNKVTLLFGTEVEPLGYKVEILNLAGEIIFISKLNNSRNQELDVSSLSSGSYLINMFNDLGECFRKKLNIIK